jgi:mono/diheme cytochrome c family protein
MRPLPPALWIAIIAGVPAGRAVAQEVDGKSVYREECKECHGLNGTPPERARTKYKKIKAVGDSGFVTDLSEDSIVTILKKGIDKNMKSFSEKLSEPEMHAVTIYIKGLGEKAKKEGT